MLPVNLAAITAAPLLPLPFTHCVVENFLSHPLDISREFLDYADPRWLAYESDFQVKKACNNWNLFPKVTYDTFAFFVSDHFVDILSTKFNTQLYPDPGLHGGGWHAHATGGVLNPHLDYSIHPKLGLQRKINLLVYVEPEMIPKYGGHLGLWEGGTTKPAGLVKEIAPLYNRAVLFDTTQNSWHGLSQPLYMPLGVYRRSLAVYYLCEPDIHAPQYDRAQFWRGS